MPLLQLMPWCPIEKKYEVGEISILPYSGDEEAEGLDEQTIRVANTVLARYKRLSGNPVSKAALIQYQGHSVLDELSEDELENTRECVELACFSGLAMRSYFTPFGPYCNTDCFRLFGRGFREEKDFKFLGTMTRRRDGHTGDTRLSLETVFTVPEHADGIKEVTFDEELLAALVALRESSDPDTWGRWENAISCFNQANTDSWTMRYHVEWVLLCSALEHLLEAKSDYRDVAQKLTDAIRPQNVLLACNAKRNPGNCGDKQLCYEWMREFYRVRGDFAHGKLVTKQPMAWDKPLEHLFLASVAFPLLVRSLLADKCSYELTREDKTQIEAFERFADEDFLNDPPNCRGSGDSWWSRIQQEAMLDVITEEAVEEIKRRQSQEKEQPS